MRYKHKTLGTIAELVKRIGDNLLCVDVADKGHYLCYPVEQWEAQP